VPIVPIVVVLVVVFILAAGAAAEASSMRFVQPAGPSDKITKFAAAIATAEGFGDEGAVPTRANNPGDLELGGTIVGEGVTTYPTPEAGWAALYAQLVRIRDGRSSVYTIQMTIGDMAANYAPADAGSWAANVARYLGVSVDTPIGTLLS